MNKPTLDKLLLLVCLVSAALVTASCASGGNQTATNPPVLVGVGGAGGTESAIQTQQVSSCGNFIAEPTLGEQCDNTDLAGATCESLQGVGYEGVLSCTASCQYDTSMCTLAAYDDSDATATDISYGGDY